MSTTAQRIPEQTIEQAKRADLLALAEMRVAMRREGPGEHAGPCPKCGGEDRFHVNERQGWWFCRQCYPLKNGKAHDAIALLRWLTPGMSFTEAVAQLAGGLPAAPTGARRVQRQPAHRPPAQQPAEHVQALTALAAAAHDRLWTPEGKPGAEYLLSRGLEPHAWLAYRLGYMPDAPLPGTTGKQRAPAIVLPWIVGGRNVYAVRYRWLTVHRYTDDEGREREARLTSDYRSSMAGRLFGGQALPFKPGSEALRSRCLLLVEGEINAVSCWQAAAAGEMRLDVLSVGSESARLTPAAVQFAEQYGRVLCWADKGEVAQRLMQALPGAYGVRSPGGKDANDLLREGLLGGFLAAVRADAAQSVEELEGLLWALWDAADIIQGIDTGSARVCLSLAERLGKKVELFEPEPGRWITRESYGRVRA